MVAIDCTFLRQIAALPDGFREDDVNCPVAKLVWEHWDELIYLARRDDRDALKAAVRLMTLDSIPGGCSGSQWELVAALFGGAELGDAFMRELSNRTPFQQVIVVHCIDAAHERGVFGCGSTWDDTRRAFIDAHPPLLALITED